MPLLEGVLGRAGRGRSQGVRRRFAGRCFVAAVALWALPDAVGLGVPEEARQDEDTGRRTKRGATDETSWTLPTCYRLLERAKLSSKKRKKLRKEIAGRLQRARKARESQDLEYEGVEWADRHRIRTRHFEVHCNSTYRVAKLYGELMEIIRAELSKMFHGPTIPVRRAPVFIYKSQEEFLEQDDLARWSGRGLGGYYLPPSQKVVAFHGTFGFTGTTFSVLCHEGTHYYEGLVLKDFTNVPIWLIEGLAVYFGDGSTFDPGKKRIRVGQIPRDRLVHIQEKMEADRHTDVRTLVNMKRYGRSPFTGSHYADAWALIYFLVNSGDDGRSLLKSYWATGIKRRLTAADFEALAARYFGSIEKLDEEYVRYISALALPSAGRVAGDYFITDRFRFLVKAPSPEWRFFIDSEDRRMLVGMLRPGSAVEIRIYYDNNQLGQEPDPYMKAYMKLVSRLDDVEGPRRTRLGGLDAFMLRYTDDGKEPPGEISVDPSLEPLLVRGKKKDSDAKKPFEGPRDIHEYKLVQVDGVASIQCSAPKGEGRKYQDVFEQVRASFVLDTTRRW